MKCNCSNPKLGLIYIHEVCAVVNKKKTSDSFAKQFASHFQNREEKLGVGKARSIVDVSIE